METIALAARRALLARREALTRLEAIDRLEAEEARAAEPREDRPAETSIVGVAEGVSERRGAEIRELDAALVRIAEARYGLCEDCGRVIGRQRLLAVPEARRCLACATGRAVAWR